MYRRPVLVEVGREVCSAVFSSRVDLRTECVSYVLDVHAEQQQSDKEHNVIEVSSDLRCSHLGFPRVRTADCSNMFQEVESGFFCGELRKKRLFRGK